MRKNTNTERIEGRIYQHDLVIKTVQNQASNNYGKEFISGNIEVAVDEAGLNVIPVHFTYVTELTSKEQVNKTYNVLKKIIDEGKTWITDGPEVATKVRINTALALNDFYTQDDTLVSIKTNEGGFVTIINDLTDEKERNHFEVDMVVTGVKRVEKDEEKNIKEDYLTIRGAIFNFRNDILPVEFILRNPAGMKYFEDLGVSNANPVYTKVWGNINCETQTVVKEEESAFGKAAVRTYERKTKEWVITGTQKVPYDFGDAEILTSDDLTKAMQNREIMLAGVKQRNEEYKAKKAAGNTTTQTAQPTNAAVKSGTFNF